MGLIIPTVGQEPGPEWANDINSSLGTLDQHSHVAGQGVSITPDAININADLPFNGFNANLVKTVNFQALSASLAGAVPNLGCIYVAGNELYYNDEAGNVIPITNSGSVNAGAGSITGLPSGTASASYSSGTQTFIWRSATLTPANMDGGSFIFRNITPSSFGITVAAPSGLATNYGLQFPAALPASTKILTLDNAGNIGAVYDVDNSTINVSSNLIQVKPGGITNTQISSSLRPLAPFNAQQISSSSGNFSTSSASLVDITNLSVTITTNGNPVVVAVQGDPTQGSFWYLSSNGVTTGFGQIALLRGASIVTNVNMQVFNVSTQISNPIPGFLYLDPQAAGTYTYKLQAYVQSSGLTLEAKNWYLVAYEI